MMMENITTSGEKQYIRTFIHNAINKLKDSDWKIEQIQSLSKILETGVGYHHAGLLPILKEIVEILFEKSLIRILFATTTFAMGLNMPARAVCFSDIMKFDGNTKMYL